MLALTLRTTQRDVIGVALGGERPLARVVGELDQEHHDDQDEGREQARGRGAAATPVEAHLLPVPVSWAQSRPVNHLAKAKGSLRIRSAYAACCTACRSEHAENLADLLLAMERAERAAQQGHVRPASPAAGRD